MREPPGAGGNALRFRQGTDTSARSTGGGRLKARPVIFVAGALANKPWNGGEAWVRLSWCLGLKRLGYHVFFVEQLAPGTCVSRNGAAASLDASANLSFFRHVTRAFGLSESACLIYGDGGRFIGLSRERVLAAADRAALLVNISGHLDWPPLFERFRCKAYIDIDPGFTQIWQAQGTPARGSRVTTSTSRSRKTSVGMSALSQLAASPGDPFVNRSFSSAGRCAIRPPHGHDRFGLPPCRVGAAASAPSPSMVAPLASRPTSFGDSSPWRVEYRVVALRSRSRSIARISEILNRFIHTVGR